VGNEIYPVVIQDDQSYPYIGLRVSGGSEDVTLDGAAGVATSIMTVGCYSPDLDQAMGLLKAIEGIANGLGWLAKKLGLTKSDWGASFGAMADDLGKMASESWDKALCQCR